MLILDLCRLTNFFTGLIAIVQKEFGILNVLYLCLESRHLQAPRNHVSRMNKGI